MRIKAVLEKGSSKRVLNGKSYDAWHSVRLVDKEEERMWCIVRSGVTPVLKDGKVTTVPYSHTVACMLKAAWKTRLRGRLGIWEKKDNTSPIKYKQLLIHANKVLYREKEWSDDNVFFN